VARDFREAHQGTIKANKNLRKLSPATEMPVGCSLWDERKPLSV